MSNLKGKIRIVSDGTHMVFCPGCKEYHGINIDKSKSPHWDFNGDYNKPTFSPSILVRSGHYVDGKKDSCWCTYNKEHPEDPAHFTCGVCHSFITDGKIQFLSDCTHELAGQTIELQNEEERLKGE